MKSILTTAFQILLVFAAFDIMILFFALAQIAIEGRTGYWNEFWASQARVFLWIVGK